MTDVKVGETNVGEIMSSKKRKNMVNELRSAHFAFGSDSKQFETSNKAQFRSAAKPIVNSADEELKKNIKASHFTLGDRSNHFYGESQAKGTFKKQDGSAVAKLNVEKLSDLRKTHFAFGNDRVEYRTDYSSGFSRTHSTPVLVKHDKNMQNFGGEAPGYLFRGQKPTYESMTKAAFRGETNYDREAQQKIKKHIGDLRKQHFAFGSDRPQWASTTKSSFQRVPNVEYSKKTMNLYSNHFSLGETGPVNGDKHFQSTARTTYSGATAPAETINSELLRDLRREHFKFGSHQVDYTPNSKVSHSPRNTVTFASREKGEIEFDGSNIRKTNFRIGTEKNDWRTTYKSTINESKPLTAITPKSTRTAELQRTNFKMSCSASTPMLSETKGQFTKRSGESKIKLDQKEMRANLVKSNFVLGTDRSSYTSSYKGNHQDLGDPNKIRSKLDRETLNYIRGSHYALGNDKPNYTSLAKGSFNEQAARVGEKDKVEKNNLREQLRRHNFTLGGDQTVMQSAYKGQMTWKQPKLVDED